MKTIGVIGGLGPQATMDFEARIHKVSQKLIPPRYNSGYPPMVVYYHRYPPFIVDDTGHVILPIQPEPHLLSNLSALAPLVDFFVITSNAPHLIQPLIEQTTGRPILSMIDATLAEVQRLGWQRVGVLGLGDPVVYTSRLQPLGLTIETLAPDHLPLRDQLDQSILAIMEGRAGQQEFAIGLEAVNTLRAKDVDGIILGCTEIPLLLNNSANATDLVNPLQLLAEAAVKHAIE